MPTVKQIAHFKPRAVWAMGKLLEDFPEWGVLDAAADLGNAGHESAGMTILQEIKPTVAGSKGGYGWYQWTGPRRRAYEAYCERTGKDAASDEANYAWHFLELKGTESRTLRAVADAKTLEAKTRAFEAAYERAGVKHHESRIAWAKIALEAWEEAQAGAAGPTVPQTPDRAPEGAVAESGPIFDTTDLAAAAERLAALPAGDFDRIMTAVALAVVKRRGLDVAAPATTGEGETMLGTKSWLKSKTVAGALTALVALLGPVFGLDLGEADVNSAVIAINDLIAAGGIILAIWGRATASTRLTK